MTYVEGDLMGSAVLEYEDGKRVKDEDPGAPQLSSVPEPEPEPDPEPGAAEPEQLSLSFNVGGKKPTTTSVRLVGGRIEGMTGELRKGEKIVLRVEAEVCEVAFVDEKDRETNQTIGCERRHKARILGVARES